MTHTEVNQLRLDMAVTNTRISKSDDLEVRVTFTNEAQRDIKLNALILGFGTLLLKVRQADGTPVPLGSPPFPPLDDGKRGRIPLKPGGSVDFRYGGDDVFGDPLAPGDYQVKFRYGNPKTDKSDSEEWIGTIESDWIDFKVIPETHARNLT